MFSVFWKKKEERAEVLTMKGRGSSRPTFLCQPKQKLCGRIIWAGAHLTEKYALIWESKIKYLNMSK